jgi:hypothetical protein
MAGSRVSGTGSDDMSSVMSDVYGGGGGGSSGRALSIMSHNSRSTATSMIMVPK